MSASPTIHGAGALGAEWERVELLGQCAAQMRLGNALDEAALARLRDVQARVDVGRQGGAGWQRLGTPPLHSLEYDVLACAVAPEVEPRVGWLFQQLQAAASQPYPSPALLQELFAIRSDEASELAAVLSEDAPLRRLGLLETDDTGSYAPYAPVRPARGISARLLGRPEPRIAPPGALLVPLVARWDDLVLPANRIQMLHELLHWIRQRDVVVTRWGARPTGGPVALFSGPPGTGKTLAASVLATELGWSLYRVDIGALVSKYIGETEKNLNRLFSAAHARPIVLLFDEADSLFGRRGDVKEARDRWANLEVSHLLARIEQHDGPCILTTNLQDNLDPAFARRFQVVVEFPRPDAAARARLWRTHVPPRAPRIGEIDFDFLAGAVCLSGGAIRNAALHAAHVAAAGRGGIGMEELALAVWRELGKDGRSISRMDLGPLARYVEEGLLC